ncbi:hypothetical protein KSP39_PZI021830 [Platanthera zijinensis]|uniref:Uncharacterized protein n=1 Tax=Platanthera zijinensis TaxID=2320716 RepID=A0AAP0AWS8_9ASPA
MVDQQLPSLNQILTATVPAPSAGESFSQAEKELLNYLLTSPAERPHPPPLFIEFSGHPSALVPSRQYSDRCVGRNRRAVDLLPGAIWTLEAIGVERAEHCGKRDEQVKLSAIVEMPFVSVLPLLLEPQSLIDLIGNKDICNKSSVAMNERVRCGYGSTKQGRGKGRMICVLEERFGEEGLGAAAVREDQCVELGNLFQNSAP